MYELSRIRLCSVGPAGARFQDVTLDFSGAGKPVSFQQAELFEAATQTLRPSQASVIFLENGGGKSVLLKLVFSVLLPGRRQVLGTSNPRLLDNFVLAQDVSHVVLEWMHAATGQRLVTAKVLAWKNQAVSKVSENLQERWYYLRPRAVLNLDNLPIDDGERHYLTLDAYRKQLHELDADDPRLELYWTKTHSDWTERLGQLGIDPELFHYQRAMNNDEGEAIRAFSLDSDAKFVDFLLGVVVPEKELTGLADLVAKHVEKLAQRRELQLEREFVEYALELLTPLIEAARAVEEWRERAAQARAELDSFAGRVLHRVRDDKTRLAQQEQLVKQAAAELEDAAHTTERWKTRVAELRATLATMRLTRAKAEVEQATKKRKHAQGLVDGWQATATVLRYQEKSGEAERLRKLVETGEERARPALEARDRAAKAFARRLLALVEAASSKAEREDAEAQKHEQAEGQARAQREAAIRAVTDAEAEARGIQERIKGIHRDVAEAVSDGLAPDAVTLQDAAEEACRTLVVAASRIRSLEEEQDNLEAEDLEAQGALEKAREEANAASGQAERAAEKLERATRLTRALASEPRLVELLGDEQVDPEKDAPALQGRLAEAASVTEREQISLQVAEARDEQARLALADGHLLPPPAVVTAACQALQAEDNILAWPGWEYIAEIPSLQKRQELISKFPHLVSGVLLNDPKYVARALEILAELRPQPTAYVAVATTRSLEHPHAGDQGWTDFVLPFHPALYDADAAEAEHHAIEERHAKRAERIGQLAARQKADQELRRRLTEWQSEYPEGAIAALHDANAAAAAELASAKQDVRRRRQELQRLQGRRREIRTELPKVREEHARWEVASRRLTTLVEQLAEVPQWAEQFEVAEEKARQQREAAEQAKAAAEDHRSQAIDYRRAAGAQRRIVSDAKQERADLPGAEIVTIADADPPEPTAVLRSAYEDATETYAKADVPGDLRLRLGQVEKDARAATRDYELLATAVRDSAHQLLETPEASDTVSRAEAQQRAVHAHAVAEQAVESARLVQGNCDATAGERTREFEELTRSGLTSMPLPQPPRDIAQCETAIEHAKAEQSVASRVQEEARTGHETAAQGFRDSEEYAKEFRNLAESFLDATSQEAVDGPYKGDAASARSEHRRLGSAKNTTQETVHKHEKALGKAAEALTHHAALKKFDDLHIPIHRQIRMSNPEQLAEHAPGWNIALRPRLRSLTDELEQIARHRQVIIGHLKGEVDKALSTLRSAQRVSTLPRSLGDWGGQEFIQFTFERIADDLLTARLGEVVEEAAVGHTIDGRKVQRDGMSLLLRGVHAAVPKGFRVFMLKPDVVLRTERIRVSSVKDVFSGGQQLTAAILLYCTMAALRANNRGRKRDRHVGVLFLDNPIGRANADYLLDLQRSVAEKLGVQLIYTTGLFDENALQHFPLTVRLRNDADLRAARKYLVVDEQIRNALDRLDPLDGTDRLTAARIFTRDTGDPEEDGAAAPS